MFNRVQGISAVGIGIGICALGISLHYGFGKVASVAIGILAGGIGTLVQRSWNASLRESAISSGLTAWCNEKIGTVEHASRCRAAKKINDCFLSKGTELDLRHYEDEIGISSLPPEIRSLQNLKILKVCEKNLLTSLPPEIIGHFQITSYKVQASAISSGLTAWCNEKIGTFEHESRCRAAKKINDCFLSKGTELDLRDYEDALGISSLPPEIGHLQNLEILRVCGNQLTSLPPEIGRLKNLKFLSLKENELASLPPEIGHLKNLKRLHLSKNCLTSMPSVITDLQNLEELDLESNRLTGLAPSIRFLQKLRRLNVQGNQITMLPPEIAHLQDLEYLNLELNPLTSLPQEIFNLPGKCNIYPFSYRRQI